MKFAPQPAAPEATEEAPADARTRDRVCRAVLEQGPVSASHLAERLGLSPAAVRRHLDALAGDGLVAVWESTSLGSPGRRGRGRPARRYVATDRGHALMSAGYDDLASSALRYLRARLGEQAVRSFAEQRVGELERRYLPEVEAAGRDVGRRAEALATALTADGYAATVRPAAPGVPGLGAQLCQGHCPVQHVAREFPELCEAETGAFSRLLGVHVQRLATLAHGEHVCTTHVPTGPLVASPKTIVPPASLTTTGRQSE
ncbi:MAG TPA: helix-turn-helix domain-containing protein [Kineosporiaceae bacterium]|nr:helix-turn-helix domain-containing protein [Kineosporiaceae bacterium]